MKLFKCNSCKSVYIFEPGKHHNLSSLAVDENNAELSVYACSDTCKDRIEAKFESGEMSLPIYSYGYLPRMKKRQVGYDPQPDQEALKREMNRVQAVRSASTINRFTIV